MNNKTIKSYKVSILVPVYGVERYIEKCARSLFEQDYENLEYIFVDDCSFDNSISLLEKVLCEYPKRKDQVRIIRHEKNRGLGAARNTAVRNASGLFLVHCDSDDWMDIRAVSLLVERQLATNADIVSGKTCSVYDNFVKEGNDPSYSNKEELLLQMLSIKNRASFVVWNRLIRASLYRDYHIEVQEGVDLSEDFQVTPKLVYYAKKVASIDQVEYYYNHCNQESYCNRLDNKHQYLWYQGLISYEILREFFADKESKYYIAASEKLIRHYWVFGYHAAKYGNKAFFEYCKSAINGKYKEYQYVLYFQNPLNKWIQQQYWICCVLIRIRSIVYKPIKRVLKSVGLRPSFVK